MRLQELLVLDREQPRSLVRVQVELQPLKSILRHALPPLFGHVAYYACRKIPTNEPEPLDEPNRRRRSPGPAKGVGKEKGGASAGYQKTLPAGRASQVTARPTFGNKTIKARRSRTALRRRMI